MENNILLLQGQKLSIPEKKNLTCEPLFLIAFVIICVLKV